MDINDAVIVNGDGLFFCEWSATRFWATSDNQFFVGSRPNAARLARTIVGAKKETVFVVTGYGLETETWERVHLNGDLQVVEKPF